MCAASHDFSMEVYWIYIAAYWQDKCISVANMEMVRSTIDDKKYLQNI